MQSWALWMSKHVAASPMTMPSQKQMEEVWTAALHCKVTCACQI